MTLPEKTYKTKGLYLRWFLLVLLSVAGPVAVPVGGPVGGLCFRAWADEGLQNAADGERVYRRVDENGTLYLTNRPDGDERYQLFGRFRARGVGMFGAEQLLEHVGKAGVTQLVNHHARMHGVDTGLVMAIIKTESDFEPTAVSPAGASGLMQLMPGTQRDLGVSDVFDPDENIAGGVRYFRSLLDRYAGDRELALAAYNAGPAAVDRYKGIPPFPETQAYVRRVLSQCE